MTPYVKDAIERVATTFVVTFLGSLIVTMQAGKLPDQAAVYSMTIASAAAALDVLKVSLARFVGDQDSAAMLPAQSGVVERVREYTDA